MQREAKNHIKALCLWVKGAKPFAFSNVSICKKRSQKEKQALPHLSLRLSAQPKQQTLLLNQACELASSSRNEEGHTYMSIANATHSSSTAPKAPVAATFFQRQKSSALSAFTGGIWQKSIDVRDFIQRNVTPYMGNAAFFGRCYPSHLSLWHKVEKLMAEERQRRAGCRYRRGPALPATSRATLISRRNAL